MKPAKSYFNRRIFMDTVKRHWWLGFINLIVLFFAVPVNFLLRTQRYSYRFYVSPEDALAELHKFAAAFFSVEGAMAATIVAMLAAVVTGLVFFSYLHKKDQVNFFHSQPVSRECLFTVRIVAGFTLFALPYLIDLVIAVIIAAIKGLFPYVAGGALLGQLGFILLVFAVIYAACVLAAVLCGSLFAQAEMTALLLFAPLLVYISIVMLCQRFYSTFYADYFYQKFIYYSPFTHLISLVGGDAPLDGLVGLIYIILLLLLLALALWLYRKRPSEGAGQPLVFSVSRPLVKYVSCFIAAVFLGMFFDQLGGLYFMIFGFVAGGLLCSLFAETQFNRDFKAMFKNMKGLALFGLGFALFVGAIAGDVTGYDQYQVAPERVKAVSFTWGDNDVQPIFHTQRRGPHQDLTCLTFTSPRVKTELQSIIAATLKSGDFEQKKLIPEGTMKAVEAINTRNLTVIFKLENGRQVVRRYNSVAMRPVKDQVQRIISSDEYKNKHAIMQMGSASLPSNIMIEPADSISPDYRVNKQVFAQGQIAALVAAIRADVQAVGETVDNRVVYTVTCGEKEYSARINIYENYRHTLALIDQIASDSDKLPPSAIQELEIRPIDKPLATPLVIDKPEEIAQVIKCSQFDRGNGMTLVDDYAITIPLSPDANKEAYKKAMQSGMMENKALARGEERYFVLGKVPAFVRERLQ